MTNLQTFAQDHLETSTPRDIRVAPAAIEVSFADPEIFASHLPRFILSFGLDAVDGARIGPADLFLVSDNRHILDHVLPSDDNRDLTKIIDRVADVYAERYAIQRQAEEPVELLDDRTGLGL